MSTQKIKMSEYKNSLSFKNKIYRLIWNISYILLFRFTCNRLANKYRVWILRLFGAKIGYNCSIAPSVKIWAPCNLIMHDHSLLAHRVICYNPNIIEIGSQTVVSEGAFFCTASHNIHSKKHELITRPIKLEGQNWVAVEAFIGMGVTIKEGAIVGARACVFKDVDEWSVVIGNPAIFLKKREIY